MEKKPQTPAFLTDGTPSGGKCKHPDVEHDVEQMHLGVLKKGYRCNKCFEFIPSLGFTLPKTLDDDSSGSEWDDES